MKEFIAMHLWAFLQTNNQHKVVIVDDKTIEQIITDIELVLARLIAFVFIKTTWTCSSKGR
jgi:hypothetical protein